MQTSNSTIEPGELQLLSSKDAAKRLAISERTLFSLTQGGKIKAVKISPRCVRYDVRDLQGFIDQFKTGGRND